MTLARRWTKVRTGWYTNGPYTLIRKGPPRSGVWRVTGPDGFARIAALAKDAKQIAQEHYNQYRPDVEEAGR